MKQSKNAFAGGNIFGGFEVKWVDFLESYFRGLYILLLQS